MSVRLRLFLVTVGLAALVLLGLWLPPEPQSLWIHYLLWTLICLLSETLWLPTLSGKRYGAGKEELAAVVMGLLEERNVVFESRHAVWSALNDYLDAVPVKTASGVRTADLADALVVNKAKITALNRNEQYRGTYTYDQAALALEGTKAP